MTSLTKKSGQIAKKLSKFAQKTSEKSKEHIKTNFLSRFRHAVEVRLLILEWVLLVSAITLLAIVQSVWYQNSYQTSVFATGGSYSEATLGDIKSLNPLFASTASEKTASRLLFATLLGVDSTGSLENQLARSLARDESGKVWTLTLRGNLKWSDGHAITADDIIYTFQTINNPSVKTIYAQSFATTTVKKLDDLTVTFTIPTAFADFPSSLTIPVLPAHILSEVPPSLLPEHAFSLDPVTSGPFTFDYVQQSDTYQTFIFARNPHYFRGETMLTRFQLNTYTTREAIATAVRNHEVTATSALPSLDNAPSDIYQKNSALNRGAFAFLNTTSPLLSSVNIRRAVRLGIDQASIRKDLNITLPLDYPILSSQAELTFPTLPTYDAATALQQLLSSGLKQESGKLFTEDGASADIIIATIDTGHLAAYARKIADHLSVLGFSVSLNILGSDESQVFISSVVQPRAYDILLYEIDLGLNPDLLPYYHSTQATSTGYNFSNYQSTIASDNILSARTTFNPTLRRSKYESFLRRWSDDVPAIGLYQSELTYFYNKNARTFSENISLVSPLDRFSDVLYWASEKSPRFRTP